MLGAGFKPALTASTQGFGPASYASSRLGCRRSGKVLTHRQILREVWGPVHANDVHYLRIYMSQLRQKLEEDPARPQYLLTEPGIGYRLRA
jgi:two-component system KDP operon response regulator KdpE